MSQQDATQAVNELKALVLSDPELKALAEQASKPDDLNALWGNERFREAHDRLIANVTEQDVRDHLSELSDAQLDNVAGGAFMAAPKLQQLSGKGLYSLALGNALQGSLGSFSIDVECRG